MHFGKSASAWWGPPKKFDPHFEERRISWLELFYDLVYVIARTDYVLRWVYDLITWLPFMIPGVVLSLGICFFLSTTRSRNPCMGQNICWC